MSTSNLNIGLPTDNPVTNSTLTRAASQSLHTSLHQQCRSLRPRLLCIRNFPDFFTLSSSADSLQTTDTVTQLWDCFASGISLCYLFNLLPPPVVPIVIDTDPSRFNVSDARAKKRAIALFAMHIRQVVQCEPFTVSDIWDRNSTDGLVKVINAVILLINRLPADRFVEAPPMVSWDSLATDTLSAVTAQEVARSNFIRELVETERKYVHDLEIMQKYSSTLSQSNTISQDTIHLLFPGLNKLLNFQRKFLIRLESTIEAPWKEQRWGLHFIENEEEFSVYEPYCTNYTSAVNVMVENEQTLMMHDSLIDVHSELPAFLIKPVQRICFYPILLDSVIETTSPADYPHYEELKASSAVAKRIAYTIDEALRRAEAVKYLQYCVEDWKGHYIQNFGQLIVDDVFVVMKSGVNRVYYVILFEKIILCCKEVGNNNNRILEKQSNNVPLSLYGGNLLQSKKATPLALKGRIFLHNVTKVVPTEFGNSDAPSSGKYALQVYWRGDDGLEFMILHCWSEEQRMQWENQMNRLIRERVNEKYAEYGSKEVFSQVSNSTNSDVNHNGLGPYSNDDQASPSHHSQHPHQRNSRPDVPDFELDDDEFEDCLASGRTTPMGSRNIDSQSMHLEFEAFPAYDSRRSLVKDINRPVVVQWRAQSTMLPSLLKVHKNLILELNRRLLTHITWETSHGRLPDTLQAHVRHLMALDAVSSLVDSFQYRAKLLEVALALACQDNPEIRIALDKDDEDIARLLRTVLASDTDKKAVLQLTGNDAERFLTVTYDILDMHLPGFDANDQLFRQKARRLIFRLSENSGILPPSLSILVANDCTKEPVAGGRFADIFRASHEGKSVALKRVREFQGHEQSRTIRRKFYREAQLWNDLQHPNVLPFYGVDLETFFPRVCMVSPWMQHGTLPQHLQRLGGPQNANVDKYILEIAEGLKYLHSSNIIHGDLKGTNVLIDDGWHARIADFGLASWDDATAATSTSHHAGTMRWMAPELLSFDAFGRTTASDVYAFACVCLEAYTGQPPFMDIPQDVAVMMTIKQNKHPNRPTTGRVMSDDLWDLVETCWKEVPTDRPQIANIVSRLKIST